MALLNIAFFVAFFNLGNTETVDCTVGGTCEHNTVNCVDNTTTCNVNCDDSACVGATINCAYNQSCIVSMTAYLAGQWVTIHGESATFLQVTTSVVGWQQLENANIYCPTNGIATCYIHCDSTFNTCNKLKIYAENTGNLHLYCKDDDDKQACTNINLFCPKENQCLLQGYPDTSAMINMTIYAENGFKTVNVSNGNDAVSIGTMYCKENYVESCIIDPISFNNECVGAPTTCDRYTSEPTTNEPTTNIPTTNVPTTNIPTTNEPTNMPTIRPIESGIVSMSTTEYDENEYSLVVKINGADSLTAEQLNEIVGDIIASNSYINDESIVSVEVEGDNIIIAVQLTVDLDTDQIESDVEQKLQDKYPGVTVNVERVNQDKQDENGSLIVIYGVIISAIISCFCIIFMVVFCIRLKKKKQNMQQSTIKHTEMMEHQTTVYHDKNDAVRIHQNQSNDPLVESHCNEITKSNIINDICEGEFENETVVQMEGDEIEVMEHDYIQTIGGDNDNMNDDDLEVLDEIGSKYKMTPNGVGANNEKMNDHDLEVLDEIGSKYKMTPNGVG
eukprot:313282_1